MSISTVVPSKPKKKEPNLSHLDSEDDLVSKKKSAGDAMGGSMSEGDDKADEIQSPKYTKDAPLLKILLRWIIMGLKIATAVFFTYIVSETMMPLITWQKYSGYIPEFIINPHLTIMALVCFVAFLIYGYSWTYPRGRMVLRNVGKQAKSLMNVWYYMTLIGLTYIIWNCLECKDHQYHKQFAGWYNHW